MRLRLAAADLDTLYLIDGTARGNMWLYQWGSNGPPMQINTGWAFDHFGCDGDGVLYAVAPSGELSWYHHELPNQWRRPHAISNNFGGFTHVLFGGSGVIYAVRPNGELLWFKDINRDGSNGPNGSIGWANGGVGQLIGNGWNQFRTLFAGRGGVVYAIDQAGVLFRFVHTGFATGAPDWVEPNGSQINSNWHQMTYAISGGNNIIFGFEVGNFSRILRYVEPLGNQVPQELVELSGWQLSRVEGYCWPISVDAGQRVSVSLSSVPQCDCSVTLVRLTDADVDGKIEFNIVSPQQTVAVHFQQAAHNASETGFGWTTSVAELIPSSCAPGLYAARVESPGGFIAHVPFVVKSMNSSQFLILVNTNTWNAYNDWGGPSNYTIPNAKWLSYLRPNPRLLDVRRDAPHDEGNHTLRAELWLINWLQSNSEHTFDLITDIDLHEMSRDHGTDALDLYKGIILQTHPEYWSLEMRALADSYIARGGTLLYLGGNGIYRIVEFDRSATGMKDFLTRFNTSSNNGSELFKNTGNPEGNLLGVQFGLVIGPAAYIVQHPHWLFAGTQYNVKGARIDTPGLNRGPSGIEIDSVARPGIDVLAVREGGGGEMTYYETGFGGFVFSVGSIAFGGSLAVDADLQTVVRNALNEARTRGVT